MGFCEYFHMIQALVGVVFLSILAGIVNSKTPFFAFTHDDAARDSTVTALLIAAGANFMLFLFCFFRINYQKKQSAQQQQSSSNQEYQLM